MIEPNYYSTEDKTLDVIEIAKMLDLNFNKGNVLKYMVRAGKKDSEREDIEKALTYLTRELEYLEERSFQAKKLMSPLEEVNNAILTEKIMDEPVPEDTLVLDKPMSYNSVIKLLNTAEKKVLNRPEIREGQAIMLTLNHQEPTIYKLVKGTDLDVWDNDPKISDLLNFLVSGDKGVIE